MSSAEPAGPRRLTLTERERGFILGSEGGAGTEGQLDRKRYLDNLSADRRRAERGQPKPFDAVPKSMCTRCGYPGPHQDAGMCIAFLRDRLSRFE